MNTSLQPCDSPASPDLRLDGLKCLDAAVAAMVHDGLPGARHGAVPAEARMEAENRFAEWLRAGPAIGDIDIVVVTGAGCGVELERLLNELPRKSRIILMERDAVCLASLFLFLPIETHMAEGRLIVVAGTDETVAQSRFLSIWKLQEAPRFRMLDTESSSPADMHFYTTVLRRSCKEVLLDIFNLGTLICRGTLWQFNTIKNLPVLLPNPGVNALAHAFAGKPALVVGAGPSLNRAIPYLKACRDGFVIISTGTALRALRNAGIRPDLVAAVDAHPLTAAQFKTQCEDLYLLCSTLVYPPATERFRGIFSGTLDANPIDHWLDGVLGSPRGQLLAAGTVTSTAIDAARKMGCNPVVTIGFDLSLADDGTTHASNTMYQGVRLDPGYEELAQVPGNYQESVITTHQFRNYIDLLQEYIGHFPDTDFVNVTDAGAKILGMKLALPADLPGFASAAFDAYGCIETAHEAFRQPEIGAVLAELERTVPLLDQTITESRNAAGLCNRTLLLLKAPLPGYAEIMERYITQLEEIDRQLAHDREASVLLEMSLWPATYWLGTRKSPGEESYTEAMFSQKRWRDFYEQVTGAATWTRDLVKDVVRQLRERCDAPATPPAGVSLDRSTQVEVGVQ